MWRTTHIAVSADSTHTRPVYPFADMEGYCTAACAERVPRLTVWYAPTSFHHDYLSYAHA
jgi:hypothetical protein